MRKWLLLGAFYALLAILTKCVAAIEVEIVSIDLFANQQRSMQGNIDVTLSTIDSYAEAASVKGIDLLAFQEGILWWFAPTNDLAVPIAPDFILVRNGSTPSGDILNPCLDQGESILKSVSCMSRRYGIVIVSNMATRSCDAGTNCKLFNTAVVTGREGELLATYRKYHVYGTSPKFDQPATQDLSYFTVDSVVVGLLVCFDLEYADPLSALIRDVPALQAVIVPMFWTNTPPLSWSVLYLQALSYKHKELTIFGVNDGSSSATWGAGVYRGGLLVSNQEAWSVPYANVLQASLPGASFPPSPLLPNHAFLGKSGSASKEGHAFNCTVPFYGDSLCIHLPDSYGQAHLSNGNASCTVDYNFDVTGQLSGESYLIALDVIYANMETTTPLHILACSVVQCLTPPSSESGQLTCEFAVNRLTLQMSSPKIFQVLPLVGKASGNTLDARHWSYVDADANNGASSLALLGSVKLGVATLIAIEQP